MKILYKQELLDKKYSCTKKTYDYIIEQGNKLQKEYTDEVLFHSYWSGELDESHLLSIMSCYYCNIINHKNRKIIIWVDDINEENEYCKKIKKFAEIIKFDINQLTLGTPFHNTEWNFVFGNSGRLTEHSNLYRLLILYVYGGVWFDLDVLFLKSFSPLLVEYEFDVSLYAWQPYNYNNKRSRWSINYPNNAIILCPQKNSKKLKDAILYINNRRRGFGFQRGNISYTEPIDFIILPCYWFNPQWMGCDADINFSKNLSWPNYFLEGNKKYNLKNFYRGAFSYHWFGSGKKKLNNVNSVMRQFYDFFTKELFK
jgi:hypothetical protein